MLYWSLNKENTVAIEQVRNDRTICGFCNTRNHEDCAIGVVHQGRHEKYKQGVVWVCGCTCNDGRIKCHACGNTIANEVDPATWRCFDVDACQASIEAKRANDPFLAQLRDIKEKVTMAKIENDQAKAEKAVKEKAPTFCLVTGEPTKGGLFKPGMDARYVSERVIEVENAKFTQKSIQAALAKMKKDGVSEKLVAKFEKSVGLAKDRIEKREAAKAAKAAEKEAEKAAKADSAA